MDKNIFKVDDDAIIVNKRSIQAKKRQFVKVISDCPYRVRSITIVSDLNVNLLASNHCSMEAKVIGTPNFKGEIKLNIFSSNDGHSLFIEAIRISKDSYPCQELSLDITLPHKSYSNISIKSNYGEVFLDKEITFIDVLTIQTQSGYIEVNPTFANATLYSESGDIDIFTYADTSITLFASTNSGNILVCIENISHIDLERSYTTGQFRNRHTQRIGHSANMNIFSKSGDIRIR